MASSNLMLTDAEKSMLIARYTELDYVEDLRHLRCCQCLKVAFDQYIISCQHILCNDCKKPLVIGDVCPLCHRFIKEFISNRANVQKQFCALQINCPYKLDGCTMAIPLNQIMAHLRQCKYVNDESQPMVTLISKFEELERKMAFLSSDFGSIRDKMDNSKYAKDREFFVTTIENLKQNILGVKNDLQLEINQLQIDVSANEKHNVSIYKSDYEVQELFNKLQTLKDSFENSEMNLKFESAIHDINEKLDESCVLLKNKLEEHEMKIAEWKSDAASQERIQQIEEALATLNDKLVEKQLDLNSKLQDQEKIINDLKDDIVQNNNNNNNKTINLKSLEEEMNAKEQNLQLSIEKIEQKSDALEKKLKAKEEEEEKLKQSETKTDFEDRIDDLDPFINFLFHQNYEQFFYQCLAYNWTIPDVASLLAKETFELETEVFPLNGYKLDAQVKLQMQTDGFLSVYLRFHRYGRDGERVELTQTPQVTYVLKDQVTKPDTKHRIRTVNYTFKSVLYYEKYYYDKKIIDRTALDANPDYSRDDSWNLLVLVETPSYSHLNASADGVLTHRIDNFRMKLQLEQQQLTLYQLSPYFYTSFQGYRVQIKMHLNGCGIYQGVGVTALVIFLTGSFDCLLPRSFKHKTTVTFFNKDLSRRVSQSCVQDVQNNRHYFLNVASHIELLKYGIVANDDLVYRVVIEAV